MMSTGSSTKKIKLPQKIEFIEPLPDGGGFFVYFLVNWN